MGYTNAVPKTISDAQIKALDCRLEDMEEFISKAEAYALRVGIDINEKVRETRARGYKKMANASLETALFWAKEVKKRQKNKSKNRENMEARLAAAQAYVEKLQELGEQYKYDIETRVAAIRGIITSNS